MLRGPRSSPGVQGSRAPGGTGERGAPARRAAPPGGRPCPAPRRTLSRATLGGSAPSARASFPHSPPCHPRKHSPICWGTQPRTHRAEGRAARAREPRAAAGGVSAALTAAPAAGSADQAVRGGGGGVAPAGSPNPARHPRPPRGPPARHRQVPPRGGVSVILASPATALDAGRAWPRATQDAVGGRFPSSLLVLFLSEREYHHLGSSARLTKILWELSNGLQDGSRARLEGRRDEGEIGL